MYLAWMDRFSSCSSAQKLCQSNIMHQQWCFGRLSPRMPCDRSFCESNPTHARLDRQSPNRSSTNERSNFLVTGETRRLGVGNVTPLSIVMLYGMAGHCRVGSGHQNPACEGHDSGGVGSRQKLGQGTGTWASIHAYHGVLISAHLWPGQSHPGPRRKPQFNGWGIDEEKRRSPHGTLVPCPVPHGTPPYETAGEA